MKRTALRRRTPLRVRLKPAPKDPGRHEWGEGLGPCVVCGTGFRVQGHHAVPKRVLKWYGLDASLWDIRNRVPVCRHDHESHETRARPIPRGLLPVSVFEFADEVGLGWYIDRHYPEAAAA